MTKAVRVALVCTQCGARNYHTRRSGKPGERLEMKKFCSRCNRHTVHKESK